MIKRILAALFGGVLFGIITPVTYWLLVSSMPLESFFSGVALLAVIGFAVGAILGALFPKVFGFIFELFLDI